MSTSDDNQDEAREIEPVVFDKFDTGIKDFRPRPETWDKMEAERVGVPKDSPAQESADPSPSEETDSSLSQESQETSASAEKDSPPEETEDQDLPGPELISSETISTSDGKIEPPASEKTQRSSSQKKASLL